MASSDFIGINPDKWRSQWYFIPIIGNPSQEFEISWMARLVKVGGKPNLPGAA
jgi:hypothetical protein